MNIIFLGRTGIHQSLLAGYLFLGQGLGSDFKKYPGFADIAKEGNGYPIFLGQDESGNMIYSLGSETDVLLVKKAVEQLTVILGSSPDQIKVVPISIPEEQFLLILTSIARVIGPGNWYYWLSRFIIKRHLSMLSARIKPLRNELARQN